MQYEELINKLENNDESLSYLPVSLVAQDLPMGNELNEEQEIGLCSAIAANHTLKSLNISVTRMSQYGICKLFDALQSNKTLESLTIKAICFEHDTFHDNKPVSCYWDEVTLSTIEHLAFLLAKNSSLKSITLGGIYQYNIVAAGGIDKILMPFLERNHQLTNLALYGEFYIEEKLISSTPFNSPQVTKILERNQKEQEVKKTMTNATEHGVVFFRKNELPSNEPQLINDSTPRMKS